MQWNKIVLAAFMVVAPFVKPVMAENSSYAYVYVYALSGYRYSDFVDAKAAAYVVDVDDSQLTADQVQALRARGSKVYSYLSIGEAENYRDYWQKDWAKQRPAFLLDENKDWKGNFRVKFWDGQWQQLILNKAMQIAQMGFDGVYLDIVDGYQQKSVIKAYPGNKHQLRQEMEQFVARISQATKSVNSEFNIIPQNALELIGDAQDDTQPNAAYLQAIDGVGIEDLWYVGNEVSQWTEGDLALARMAKQQGKFVLATSYPTHNKKQLDFVQKAMREGFIPFVGHRSLAKKHPIAKINREIPAMLATQQTGGARRR